MQNKVYFSAFSTTATENNKEKRELKFFSLKWSALILISMVFLVADAFFYQYNQNNLFKNFEENRASKLLQNRAQLNSLISQSSKYALLLAEIIPTNTQIVSALKRDNPEALSRAVGRFWASLAFQTEIDGIGLLDKNMDLIQGWGYPGLYDNTLKSQLHDTLEQVVVEEIPAFKVICREICTHYAFVPLMVDGERKGSVFIARSLTDIIMNFSNSTQLDVALLTRTNEFSLLNPEDQNNNPWNMEVMMLSNFATALPVFQQVSTAIDFNETLNQVKHVMIDGKTYEVMSYEYKNSNGLFISYIDEITERITEIQAINRKNFLTSMFALVVSEIALLIILWKPLSNLRHASDVIPLLATNSFSAARRALYKKGNNKYVKNEIDVLDENIIEVSYRLESLHNNISEYTQSLSNNMHELKKERDFIQSLLDTAHVIIVTHDSSGNIQKSNTFMEELTEYNEREIKKQNFYDLILMESGIEYVKFNLEKILSGEILNYTNEAMIVTKSGNTRCIEWMHSRITSNGTTEILSVGMDLTERKKYEDELSWMADHDPLTKLLNRRRFHELLTSTINTAKRYKTPVALLFLDLDNFKHINDTLGHEMGDVFIQSAAANLKLVLRESDVIARFGGDEFAIILPHVGEEGAIDVANKINKSLSSMRIPSDTSNMRTTASIGISLFPEHGEDEGTLLSNADLSMYQAKAKGRGGWHLFSITDDTRAKYENQMYWQNKINEALENKRFELHFQPIINLADNSISHYEALIRMIDEDGKEILPTPFIKVAEKTGLIHRIDHYVLQKSIEEIQYRSGIGNAIKLAVNLSANVFDDDKIFDILRELINHSAINPDQLIFEITETAALSDLTGAAELINKMRALGCHFALDDFGVGFSSFYYLRELPVDYVKIDGSFIQKLPSNRNDQILVKAITEIAKEFGKKTIAEFVEDHETLMLLKEYNVDYAQGYFIGNPAKNVA